MILSLLGNLSVVIAVLTQRSMRTTVNYYLLNMAVADVLIVIFCMWVHFMKVYIFDNAYKLGPFVCRIESFAKSEWKRSSLLNFNFVLELSREPSSISS